MTQSSEAPQTILPSDEIGYVIIGKNEGDRLKRCLLSLPSTLHAIYVDSGSSDGSVELARAHGVDVVELDLSQPFTAARARNTGFARLGQKNPRITFVQFIDGDCELARDWPMQARGFLASHSQYCAVFGRRRERFPARSIYNALCDIEWNVPVGEARSFGGDVLIRAEALRAVEGYRADIIAGEEPELCVRLRARGWKIWRLDQEMTLHDAAITRFPQWWRRTVRSGYAFAQGKQIHGAAPENHWVWESRRALTWGVAIPLVCLVASLLFPPWGLVLWLVYPLQIIRRMPKAANAPPSPFMQATFEILSRFAESVGQLKFFADRVSGRRDGVKAYK